ncbi:tyrosine-type recombinase/integrase [Tenacibaculum jejuense]|uniref:Tyrosine recombinase XerC n=1 Tax=Tenacibaculum jejuense TaxID=584609 RepID=A0A238U719_9FLAO|nr:tyrosine-type recombinase/integrase [Tenacibaculum jejuense]SNR14999.1 Tyrosine recombinase XerC [Tenacibaculum jejuense]
MFIDAFLDYLSLEKKYSAHTVLAYKTDLIAFKDYCEVEFDQVDLESINYNQIRSWIVTLVDQGISNRTINRKVSSLKTFYKFLQKIEVITANPLSKHKALKTQKKNEIPFSIKEMENVFKDLNEDDFVSLRNRLIVELFYSTGMRRIELINIKLSDVDLSSNTVKILGKRNKERIVPLIFAVTQTLKKYITSRNEIVENNEYLFITEKGNKIYETLVYRIINRYFSKVSTKTKKSPHILRHTFATQLLNQGADLNSVKELLGHSSLASTQVYTHNNLEQLKQVFNKAHPRSKKKD